MFAIAVIIAPDTVCYLTPNHRHEDGRAFISMDPAAARLFPTAADAAAHHATRTDYAWPDAWRLADMSATPPTLEPIPDPVSATDTDTPAGLPA